MKYRNKMTRYGLSALTAALLSSVAPVAAYAQAAPDSSNALLIAILVKRGVITKSDAAEIMHQVAAEQAEAAAAPVRTTAPAVAPQATAVASTSPDGTIHVTYVPRNVQEQIATQVKQEVLATEQAQGYAMPDQIPDWVNHLHIYGDIRTRYEGDMFPSGNDDLGDLPNFNAINTGSPFDTSQANPNFPPQLNTDQNRNRFELRARLGVDADLGDGFSTGIRIATGQTNSPVS
jgi:hypothetical protein